MELEKLAYPIPEATEILPFGRATLYRMAGRGEIEIKQIGGRSLVTRDEILRVINGADPYQKGWKPQRKAANTTR